MLQGHKVTQEHLHQLGLIVARCRASGWRDVFITDDFGNLQRVASVSPIYVHVSN